MATPARTTQVEELFQQALPAGEGGHVLTLGEYHANAGHLQFLTEQLSSLQDRHDLDTIGLEARPFMNVFLWAYRDGNLPVHEHQGRYLEHIFEASSAPEFSENAVARAHLLKTAVDNGMRTVCFDARNTL